MAYDGWAGADRHVAVLFIVILNRSSTITGGMRSSMATTMPLRVLALVCFKIHDLNTELEPLSWLNVE
jgi:hypothetical protein